MQRTCNGETRSRNQCCSGKAKSITYSECVSVALVIQHAKCIHRIILLPVVARPDLSYLSTLSHKGHDFIGIWGRGGGGTEHKMLIKYLIPNT